MITIEQARERIGAGVVYRAPYEGAPAEQGTITSVNDRFVFVRYGLGGTSASTDPHDLVWLSQPAESLMVRDRRTPDEVMADLAADRYEASLDAGWER